MLDVLSETISSDNQAYSIWYTMMMKFVYFSPVNFEGFIEDCKRQFSYHEPVLYYVFPYNGAERRIEQIIQDHTKSFPSPVLHIRLSNAFEDPSDIELFLKSNHIDPIENSFNLFVTGLEYLIQTSGSSILSWLTHTQTENQGMGLILFSEAYITHHDVRLLGSARVVSNISYYPLLSIRDSRAFALYLSSKWKIQLSETALYSIVKNCGGHLWLIKQAVRILRDDPSFPVQALYSHDAIQYQLASIYDALSDKEKEILYSPHVDRYPEHKKHLIKLNVINNQKCTIPYLASYIQEHWKRVHITIEDSAILFNDIPVDRMFSHAEFRVLKYFLSHKNKLVSREQVADLLWPEDTESRYSDWAIDQTMKRMRAKLQKLGIGKDAIKTMRSFGYRYSY